MQKAKTICVLLLILVLCVAALVIAACQTTIEPQLYVTVSPSAEVNVDDDMDDIKQYLTVRYTDVNGKSNIITDYEIQGDLKVGKTTLTARYAGLSATFELTVKAIIQPTQYEVVFIADGRLVDTLFYTEESTNINEPQVPEKSGYKGCWDEYTLTTGNITVNAIYTAKQYTITLDYNGATGSNTQQTITVTYDQAIGDLITPIRDESIFLGWYLDSTKVTSSTVWTTDSNVTLIAKWQKMTKGLQYSREDLNSYYVVGKGTATDTDIVIPTTYNNTSVTGISSAAFKECGFITSITIPDSVTSIGGSAFEGCSSLTSVTIGKSVTSIGDYAFSGCSSLTSITIPDSVTSIGSSAFEGCSSLTYNKYDNALYLGNESNPYVVLVKAKDTNITSCTINEKIKVIYGSALYNCSGLTSITIPNNVISIGQSAFCGCSSLTSVTIPSSVTSIGEKAFDSCNNITTATMPMLAISYISKTKLQTVVLTSGESIDDSAFYGCNSLTSVTIPDSVKSIGSNAFSLCSSLTSVTIPDSVKSIGGFAFSSCSNLTNITIPNSVTSIGIGAFDSCNSLTKVNYLGTIADWCDISFDYKTVNATFWNTNPLCVAHNLYLDDEIVTELVIPDTVTEIKDIAFVACTSITNIIILNGVTSIGDDAFKNCYRLIEVYNKSSLTITAGSSGNGYVGCYAKNVYTTAGGSKLTTDDNGFVIYDGNTLVDYVGEATEITIPNTVIAINIGALYNRTALTSITIPDSVKSIGYRAFYGCSSLTSIIIPNNVTSIGSETFSYCSKLTIYCEAASKPNGWHSNWNHSNRPVVWGYKPE